MLTETPKSLLYRFQYWQATAAMIADHPWFGCGPGNFQHYYTQYKLPEASELIADPHNLFFEVAATAGVPALLAFVAVLLVAVWPRRGATRTTALPGRRDGPEGPSYMSDSSAGAMPAAPMVAKGVYVGSLVGVALGWWTGFVFGMLPDAGLLMCGLPAGALLVAALHPWTIRGQMPAAVPWLALLVLTVNLLAAGGISFAGIAPVGGCCWRWQSIRRRRRTQGGTCRRSSSGCWRRGPCRWLRCAFSRFTRRAALPREAR